MRLRRGGSAPAPCAGSHELPSSPSSSLANNCAAARGVASTAAPAAPTTGCDGPASPATTSCGTPGGDGGGDGGGPCPPPVSSAKLV
eukprot:2280105-Prymnesium_polylepis.1